ncbi:thioredoxin family protein [Oceanivirga salmonicida]|uniref:thioredoxin family protein n=1 Tax=Oceanivirga salmonicida TaxID=1769291 RepID=UPI00082BFE21|nr:thioredoxin domain-containing protein [Oceanivirga salmonicida]
MSKVIEYSNKNDIDNLLEETLKSGLTIVDFYANWCGACMELLPILDELSNEVEDKIIKANVDSYMYLAEFYGVRSIPTMVIFKDSKPVETIVGAKSKENLKEILDKLR